MIHLTPKGKAALITTLKQLSMLILGLALLSGCAGRGVVELDLNNFGEGTEVFIDGDFKGNLPKGTYEVTLAEGKHEIELIKRIPKREINMQLAPGKYDQFYAKKSIVVADKSTQLISVGLDLHQSPEHKLKWKAKRRKEIEALIASIESNMITIPSGSLQMGSNDGTPDEKPVHTVHVNSFKISKYEVTQAQWEVLAESKNRFTFEGAENPAENISWEDAHWFISKLNKYSTIKFRLPSEAEWEYAARAGSTSKWSWGDSESPAESYAWFFSNSEKKTHPVGQKRPNAFGLYDMHGNVWEWVQDCWNNGYNGYNGAPGDGEAWIYGACDKRVLRGGGVLGETIGRYALSESRYGFIVPSLL